MVGEDAVVQAVRVRDPDRAAKILDAAAHLFAARGFHAVAMSEIGPAAGIVGSGIYRHFESKYAVLVALLEDVMGRLLESAEEILAEQSDPAAVLRGLVQTQVDFCLDHRVLIQLYRHELQALKPEDSRRLRRMQRRYNEEWTTAVLEVRPELNDADARSLVHAAIGAIQSIVTYESGKPRAEQSKILTAIAEVCLTSRW